VALLSVIPLIKTVENLRPDADDFQGQYVLTADRSEQSLQSMSHHNRSPSDTPPLSDVGENHLTFTELLELGDDEVQEEIHGYFHILHERSESANGATKS